MAQNTSQAVKMARKEPLDSLDYFPTMPWGTRALCNLLLEARSSRRQYLSDLKALEPCCGEGFMSRPLAEAFGAVFAALFIVTNILTDLLYALVDPRIRLS